MLYKYKSFDAFNFDKFFTDGEMYFSNPSQFNDPFESKPAVIGLDSLDDRKEYARDYIKRNHSDLPFKKRAALEKKFIIRLSDVETVKEDIHSILNEYGVLCVSKEWNQILMWSHYSKSHTGICIGIEFDKDQDSDFSFAHDVLYEANYPEINPALFKSNDDALLNELFEVTLLTKATQWSYEKEVRFIKLRREGGSGAYNINKQKIKEIILGARINKTDKQRIIELANNHVPWATVYQATVSDSEFNLCRHTING